MSSICTSIMPLEYQEAGSPSLGLLQVTPLNASEEVSSVILGVPEEEVERRIQIARDSALAEADRRIRMECDRVNESAHEKMAEALKKFGDEGAQYFRRVEGEVVQLALAIARKILQREAELDPTLLIALVRVALDRMQCGSLIRIRVASENVELWRRYGDGNRGVVPWEIVADETLNLSDCIVETELGTANFGIEAQLRDVQESFAQLLAHRPAKDLHHAAAA